MRYFSALLFLCFATTAQAETSYFHGYAFEAYVLRNNSARLYERWDNGQRVVHVNEGQEYSVVIRNPLPVRVAVALTIDGLNTIDGKSASAASSSKWLIRPYSSVTIRGWQTGSSNLRKFVFTRPEYSYAAWREDTERRSYQHNLGQIKVAYFWNSSELRNALNSHHGHVYDQELGSSGVYRRREKASRSSTIAPRYDDRAGTGMGRREHHRVSHVSFHYDTGMYSDAQAIKINYKFGTHRWQPHPRPWVPRYSHPEYTPEMP